MKEFIYPEIELLELEIEDIILNSEDEWVPDDPEGGLGWG